jgi:cytochrome c oxidase assembly protein subunit 11
MAPGDAPEDHAAAEPARAPRRRSHRPLIVRLALFTLGSFAFGFALVPLYSVLCKVWDTGNRWYGSQTAAAAVIERPDPDRVVTVEFIANIPGEGDWEFRPHVTTMAVHPGKLYETTFYARNLTGGAVVAQAVPSIAPASIARYFRKTECFCFRPQPFAIGEGRDMPIRFIIDRELPADFDRVTLAYSFFDLPQAKTAAR